MTFVFVKVESSRTTHGGKHDYSRKNYKAFWKQDSIKPNSILTSKKGEIFGFLGPSGAGKTTLINILTGQLKADEGTTQLLGKDTKDLTPEDLAHIGLVGDSSGYYEKLSLEKNLIVYAKIYGLPNSRVDEVLEQVGLLESKKTIAEKLSTGMRQRMFLARALLNRPELLFLDEPTSGLDPMTSKKIHRLLEELKAAGDNDFP